jgi:hypothetical protein
MSSVDDFGLRSAGIFYAQYRVTESDGRLTPLSHVPGANLADRLASSVLARAAGSGGVTLDLLRRGATCFIGQHEQATGCHPLRTFYP